MAAPIRSILFLQSGALGDTVLQLRLAQVLKRTLGEAGITWLGRDAWLPIARGCAHIDRLAGMDAMRIHRLFEEGERTDADLADWLDGFDLILNGLAPDDSAAAERLRRFARQAVVTYDTKPQEGSVQHVVRQWLDQIAAPLSCRWPELGEGIDGVARQLMHEPGNLFQSAGEDTAGAMALLHAAGVDADSDTRFVLVHPGSGGRGKCWPIENYVQLVEVLAQHGTQPVLVLGPVEMELLGEKVDPLRQRHCLVTDPSLTGLMALTESAAAYIGNDAGPTHLAAALGARTIAIFGPTDPRLWQPIGPSVTVLKSQAYDSDWNDLPPTVVAAAVTAD